MNFLKTLLRILFLGYLSYLSYQNLQNVETSAGYLGRKYIVFEETLKSKFGLELPQQLSSSLVNEHAILITKSISYASIGLSLLSVVVCSYIAWAVGFLFLVESMIINNFLTLSVQPFNPSEWYELAFALAVFGMTVYLCADNKCCVKENINVSKVSKNSRRTASPRRNRRSRE